MARWRLTTAHYLNGAGAQWEYTEVDRKTGSPVRHRFDVPRLVDPADPKCWTITRIPNEEGDCVVSDGVDADPRDIIWKGDPTPDMIPLDADAERKSAAFSKKWQAPTDGQGAYTDNILNGLQAELAKAMAQPTAKVEGMGELLEAMKMMMAQNQQMLQAMLAGQPARRGV